MCYLKFELAKHYTTTTTKLQQLVFPVQNTILSDKGEEQEKVANVLDAKLVGKREKKLVKHLLKLLLVEN